MQFLGRTGRYHDLHRDGSSFPEHRATYDDRPVQRLGPCGGEHRDLYGDDRQQLHRQYRRTADPLLSPDGRFYFYP